MRRMHESDNETPHVRLRVFRDGELRAVARQGDELNAFRMIDGRDLARHRTVQAPKLGAIAMAIFPRIPSGSPPPSFSQLDPPSMER